MVRGGLWSCNSASVPSMSGRCGELSAGLGMSVRRVLCIILCEKLGKGHKRDHDMVILNGGGGLRGNRKMM